jgi:2-hydroxychromene-2-carboxylate isomerase
MFEFSWNPLTAINETYNETVAYWSRDDAISDAADAVAWSVSDDGREVLAKKGDEKVTEFVNDAKNAALKTAFIGVPAIIGIGLAVYFAATYTQAKAKRAAG